MSSFEDFDWVLWDYCSPDPVVSIDKRENELDYSFERNFGISVNENLPFEFNNEYESTIEREPLQDFPPNPAYQMKRTYIQNFGEEEKESSIFQKNITSENGP